jgi:hypothetical protein
MMAGKRRKALYNEFNQFADYDTAKPVQTLVERRLESLFRELRRRGLTWLEVEHLVSSSVHGTAVFYRVFKGEMRGPRAKGKGARP